VSGFVVEISVERRPRRGPPFRLDAAFRTPSGITAVYGPSGSGKTTLLLALAGALRPTSGRIEVRGRTLYDGAGGIDLPVSARKLGLVFQDALLFPHLDVRQNVGFGVPRAERERRTSDWLDRVGATHLARRKPSELSGGERQRVALARALAAEPEALLLDEPFSAVDPPGRAALGRLLVDLRRSHCVPFLHVTHDLAEALAVSEHLVVLEAGRVVESGPAADVVARPASVEAARALGTANLLAGTVREHRAESGCTAVDVRGQTFLAGTFGASPGDRVTLALRAEDVLVAVGPVGETSARNVVPGQVVALERRASTVELRVETPLELRVTLTPASVAELRLAPGSRVVLLFKATALHRVM
jgi:molybdate transport system ATP-binding protein